MSDFNHRKPPPDDKEKAKIVSLRRDHGVALGDLAMRFGRCKKLIVEICGEAGIHATRPKEAAQVEQAFALIEQAAVAGERCPMNDIIPGASSSVSELARTGRVLVEVYVRNFRRVTILTGAHRGKTTADPPKHGRSTPSPYLTIGRSRWRNGRAQQRVISP